jgi:hypothetical protein
VATLSRICDHPLVAHVRVEIRFHSLHQLLAVYGCDERVPARLDTWVRERGVNSSARSDHVR